MQSNTGGKKILSLAAPLALLCVLGHAQVVVHTKSGRLEGISAGGAVSFKAMPYATPPVGNLRWKPPLPTNPWPGVRKAHTFSAACIQHKDIERLPWSKEFMVQGPTSEDCLYLNVWTPADFKGRKLPVYVFFHGGGFTEGAGSVDVYDGTNLTLKGLVFVAVNYRLGALGFLAHPQLSAESPHHVSGNYGFLDAVASLQWVKDNIAAFGGDPRKVTIGGQSAGSGLVHDLSVSPMGKLLFRGAVAESGTSLVSMPMKIPWPEHPEFQAFHTGEMVYILSNLEKLPRPFTDVDRAVAITTSSYLVNFVSTGDPNGKGLPKWTAFTTDPAATLEISDSTAMRSLMDPKKLAFWRTYFDSPQGQNAPFF